MLRALADQFGGDPAATDSTRVLRLPGFANKKYEDEFIVQVLHESNRVYQSRDFMVQEDSPETPRYLGDESGRRLPQGHKSQSEHDWAYAKRALARGDDPEVVIQRIADFRAEDKARPDYYAQHTVAKAKEQIDKKRSPRTTRNYRENRFKTLIQLLMPIMTPLSKTAGSISSGVPLLTPSEVAQITGLSIETLAQWRSQRRGIPFVKVSRNCVRYRQSDLDRWLEERIVSVVVGTTTERRQS